MKRRSIIRWGFAGLVAVWALVQAALTLQEQSGNIHTVVEGEVYRSAQLSPEQLAGLAGDTGLKSVLNLRGAAPGEDWYDQELATSQSLGLVHVDFAMIASRVMTVEDQARLIEVMRSMPKPMLVHCRRGADRTGLAMALYLAGVSGQDLETAAGQLSLRYGHFSVPYLSKAYPMDESWQLMLPFLGADKG